MASLDHRLNPLFAIKECSSCGALYTADFCCSKGGFVDKILVPKPPQNCPTRNCGDTVHLKSHSSSIKTPVKIPRKVLHKLTTIVVTSVGNNALDELLQTLPSVHPTCNSGNENSFTYDSKPNFVDDSPNSSVEDLVHTLSESDGISEGECDLPVYDDFSSLKKDEVLDDIISIPPGNGNDHFNAESSLIESVLNRDNVISSPKIDFLIEEFAGELALIAPILSGIVKADLDPKEDIHFSENLIYDNSFPRPPETLKDDYETVIDSNNDYFLSVFTT
ncbi:hypothetical protein Tco_0390541 [Tanacetum coccineum]|uniref:Uncharacterized protein n=1 Tax=Tanacetum coccineum TaxID=301880 RepID=A0ABQ4YV24_9ASTR